MLLFRKILIQLSCGYNGLPRGLKETKKRWNKNNKKYYVIHAEQNAIIHAAKTNININNSILICNRFPCHNCALTIVQAGIKTIVTIDPWENVSKNWEKSFKISEEIFKELNIEIIKINENEILIN